MARFTELLKLNRFAMYIFDYGAPTGLRMAVEHPERVTAIITQNGKAYTSTMLTAFRLWYFVSKVSFYGSAKTDCEYTRSKLEKLGVTCAPLNRTLIETYVRAGIREGYFPSPRGSPS